MGLKLAQRWCRVRVLSPADEAAASLFAAIVRKYQEHQGACNHELAERLEDELLRLEAVRVISGPTGGPPSR